MDDVSTKSVQALAAELKPPLRTDVKIAVVLTEQERATFFPQGLGAAVEACEVASINNPAELSEAQWEAFLLQTQPEILIGCWSLPRVSERIVEHSPQLRHIAYVTGSLSKKVARSFIERGGYATNWGDEAAYSVAECALMLGLMSLRKATRFAMEMHVDRGWSPRGEPRGLSLFNRRVGIYGFGAVARKLIELLKPFNVEIEAYSAPVPSQVFAAAGVREAESLHSLFAGNDVVFIVEALTPATTNSVDQSVLSQLQDNCVVVNVGRGAVVDEVALAQLAEKGKVHIGLDVYASEPLAADSPLRGLRNVTLLPHTAGPTIDFYPACGARALRNVETYLRGEVPPDHNDLKRYDLAT